MAALPLHRVMIAVSLLLYITPLRKPSSPAA